MTDINDCVLSDFTTFKEHGIAIISINRPNKRNAVDRNTAESLVKYFKQFDNDDSFKVAILYGGEKVFCSGADLTAMSDETKRNRLEVDGDGPMGISRLKLQKPVIAAINGYCVAGGLELALWCDMRVADQDATLGVFCRRFGVPLIDGGTIRLPRLIGMSRALDLILTGRPVNAKEAFDIGLVNRISPKGKVLDTAIELAKLIGSFPQTCMRSDRQSAYEQWDLTMDEAIRNEFKLGRGSLEKEGLSGAQKFQSGTGRHGNFKLESKL